MKNIFRYLASVLVGAMTLAACQQEIVPLGTEISVNPETVSVAGQNAGNETVTVTADGDWVAVAPNWIKVAPANGGAGETTVTLSFADNLDEDKSLAAARKGTVLFSVNEKSAELVVEQAGDPDKAPAEVQTITCAEFNAQEDGAGPFRVIGTIVSIQEVSAQYQNATLTINDGTADLYLYRVLPKEGEKIEDLGLAVGDKITVEGKKGSYKDSPQMAEKTGVILEVEKSLISVSKVLPEVLPMEGGELMVNLMCKGEGLEVVIPEDASWLTVTSSEQSGELAVVVLAAVANEGGNRTTDVEFVTAFNGTEYKAVITVAQNGAIKESTVADFLAEKEGPSLYQLTGKVANLNNTTYGNFDLVDATGSVYVYGLTATPQASNDKSFESLGINEGDVVTLIGTRSSHNGTAQVGGPAYYVSHIGHTEVTVEDFLAREKSKENWYKLTGRIDEIVNEEYGNFYLEDETGRVYVYGLTAAPVAKNDKSFKSLGLKRGDIVTLVGTRDRYDNASVADQKEQVGGPAYYISHEEGTAAELTYTVAGTLRGEENRWNPDSEAGLMTKEGDWWVVKGLELVYDYTYTSEGEDYVLFKICETGDLDGAFGLSEKDIYKPNEEIAVVAGGSDIYLDRSGVYDVYFDETNGKVWVMDEGYAPGEEKAELDGYQWMAKYEDLEVLFDFGLTEEGMLSIAMPLMDGTGYGLHMTGYYEIEAEDKSSGVIFYTGYDWEWDEMMDDSEFEYFELTATTVKLVCEDVFGVSDAITLTRVAYPYDIELPGGEGGGDDPQGPVANGWYRLYNSGKVMAPLAVGVTSGNAPASSTVNADENKFKFTYDPDMTGYTVQDVYGRYYGQTDVDYDSDPDEWGVGEITVTETLPSGDDYCNYLWVVDNSYDDGTTDIYNMVWYCGFGYSSSDDYWYLTEATYETAELRPFLVPAEVPLPEQEPDVPADPWEGENVVSYDLPESASSSRQVLRNIKYYADKSNINIRLVASVSKIAEVPTDGLTISLYDKTDGTVGKGFYNWWNDAKGDVEYNAERCGTITGSALVMSVDGTSIDVQTVVDGDLVTWTFAFPRSANPVMSNDKVYMGILTLDAGWNATGAMPDKYAEMLEVTLP